MLLLSAPAIDKKQTTIDEIQKYFALVSQTTLRKKQSARDKARRRRSEWMRETIAKEKQQVVYELEMHIQKMTQSSVELILSVTKDIIKDFLLKNTNYLHDRIKEALSDFSCKELYLSTQDFELIDKSLVQGIDKIKSCPVLKAGELRAVTHKGQFISSPYLAIEKTMKENRSLHSN